MKKILIVLFLSCFLILCGCDDTPVDYKAEVKEATVVNMTMNGNEKGGMQYWLLVEDENKQTYRVVTDTIIFHQVTFGSRVQLTYGWQGWAAIAVFRDDYK